MTDKPIIIDGVDVSGCDFLAREDFYSSYSGEYSAYKGQCGCSDDEMCKDHRNCGYKKLAKQLQRKTAEHERLCRDYFKQNEWLQQRAKECEQLQHKLQIATEALEIIANQNFKYTSENICNLAQNEQIPCSNNCKYCFQQYAQHALEQIEGILNEK